MENRREKNNSWPSSIRHSTLVFFVVAYWNTNFHSRKAQPSRVYFSAHFSLAINFVVVSLARRALFSLTLKLLRRRKAKEKKLRFHLVCARAIFHRTSRPVLLDAVYIRSITFAYHIWAFEGEIAHDKRHTNRIGYWELQGNSWTSHANGLRRWH